MAGSRFRSFLTIQPEKYLIFTGHPARIDQEMRVCDVRASYMNQASCVVQRIYARSLLSGRRCSFSPSRGSRIDGFDSGPTHVNCKPHLVFGALVLLVCAANPTAVFATPLDWFKFGPTQAVDVVTISYGS